MTVPRLLLLGAVVAVAAMGGWFWSIHRGLNRVEVGATAPDFHVVNVATGKAASLHDSYAGGVTLVNIWGTWCAPCIQEMPAMDSLFQSLGPRGFRIAAVSVDEPNLNEVRQFVAQHQIHFDALNDPTGRIKDVYQTTGVPESFLIDRTGHIIRIAIGATPWNSAENHRIIEELLAHPDGGR
jgi:cytochrome c biogenesis protein CcmG/thiol:disulfide interchange protein DsbE